MLKSVKYTAYEISPEDFKSVREDLGYNQNDFAQELGVSTISIKKYESGDSIPSLKVLSILTEKFGINFVITPKIKHPLLIARKGS